MPRLRRISVRCPICGMVGTPHHIANHFVKEHKEAYAIVQMYGIKYKVGWLCKICGKDFLFITSLYVHILKEHLSETVDNHINILPIEEKLQLEETVVERE